MNEREELEELLAQVHVAFDEASALGVAPSQLCIAALAVISAALGEGEA